MKISKIFKRSSFGLSGRKFSKRNKRLITFISLLVVSLLVLYVILLSAPADFDHNTIIRIDEGTTVREAGEKLAERQVIRYPVIFIIANKLFSTEQGIIAGDYYFKQNQSVITVARRLANGSFDIDPIRVTIPEGLDVNTTGLLLDQELPLFDREKFELVAAEHEGYLFPDTYFFSPFATEEDIAKEMRRNFDRQMSDLYPEISRSPRNLSEIVIMASLLEKEANTTESRKIIAGILWKRIEAGMRLQVDAVFPYIIGKNTFDLTRKDLAYDSPYNTYRYEGLPPGPIASPSRDSIMAALYPTDSPFWFYLSDMRGQMHYAITYEDHLVNRDKYLR